MISEVMQQLRNILHTSASHHQVTNPYATIRRGSSYPMKGRPHSQLLPTYPQPMKVDRSVSLPTSHPPLDSTNEPPPPYSATLLPDKRNSVSMTNLSPKHEETRQLLETWKTNNETVVKPTGQYRSSPNLHEAVSETFIY